MRILTKTAIAEPNPPKSSFNNYVGQGPDNAGDSLNLGHEKFSQEQQRLCFDKGDHIMGASNCVGHLYAGDLPGLPTNRLGLPLLGFDENIRGNRHGFPPSLGSSRLFDAYQVNTSVGLLLMNPFPGNFSYS
jgi:hypothetical protein